jgi:hypothetical protein
VCVCAYLCLARVRLHCELEREVSGKGMLTEGICVRESEREFARNARKQNTHTHTILTPSRGVQEGVL